MEIPNKEDLSIHNQNTLREVQFEEEGNRQLEVPSIGNDDLNRVTKISEPYDLSGSYAMTTEIHAKRREPSQDFRFQVLIIWMIPELIQQENLIGR